ncbi:glycosyltransferase [Paenibacillus hemerocallicola]|nr:glycosyltransferase [Paenibacillus hemerocallicola]
MKIALCSPSLEPHFVGLAKGRYLDHLFEALAQRGPEHTFIRYIPEAEGDTLERRQEHVGRFLTEHAVDLFVITDPFIGEEQTWHKEWFGRTKVAALLLEWSSPEVKDGRQPDERNNEPTGQAPGFLRSCDLVLTPTDSLKQAVASSAGIQAEKIDVISGGIDPLFGPVEITEQHLSRYGIPGRYVLCAGTGLSGRQGKALIAAFGMACRELDDPLSLVIADDAVGQEREKLLALADAAGVRERLLWTGPVDGEELASLYGGAELLAFLGTEGSFGFPLLEAMACGTPVLAPDRGEWNELGDNAIYRVKPCNAEQLHIGLKVLLNVGSSRSFLVDKGKMQARKYQWRACAEKALRAFSEACRKRVAIFAARSTVRTGSINRLQLLLPVLTEKYDCDLYVGNGSGLSEHFLRNRKVRLFRHEEFPERAEDYKAILYQVDYTDPEASVPEFVRQHPGIVLVDDEEPSGAVSLLSAEAGTFVVHHEETARWLQENGCKSVKLLRKPVKLPVMVSAIMDRDFTFASCGRIEPGDGLDSALDGIRRLIDSGYDDVRMWAAGECDPDYRERLLAHAEELGVSDRVELIGPLGEDEYGSRMIRSDVCLFLRKPGSGELSGDLLDMMSYGKPTVVLGAGAHLELPDDVVRKTENDTGEGKRLSDAMLHLYEDKELRKKMRKQSRAYVAANHSASRYANRVLSLIEGNEENENTEEIDGFETDVPQPVPEPAAEEAPPILDAGPEPGATGNEAEVSPATGNALTLGPNRIRRIRKGKAVRCYFSFDLATLPPGVTIKSAVMHIPARTNAIRVHRISADWSAQAVARRKPRVRPKPIFSSVRKLSRGAAVFRWDCTQLARMWQTGAMSNHGVYAPAVSAVRKPWLSVEYGYEGDMR